MTLQKNEADPVDRLHRQIGSRRPYRRQRPLSAMGFLYRGVGGDSHLVELSRLTAVLLFDEFIARSAPALRLVGYGASQVPHGVLWGGSDNSKFYKDLRIATVYGGSGLQLDSSNTELLGLSLRLQSTLYRVDCFCPRAAAESPVFPRIWAGFSLEQSQTIRGDGPELAALCEKFSMDEPTMLSKFTCEHQGLVCFPMEWVTSQLTSCLTLFADLSETPKVQVFQLPSIAEGLQGFQDASEYDFYSGKKRELFMHRLARNVERKSMRGPVQNTNLAPVATPTYEDACQ
ncbi:hypothetical protein Psta_3712 [Pirellula staleyi DSM 6068]|uniref:Uncharacterized protein n=1 Tax=Pirellula staleyi (strain ATCC 27377 / DSM 6068 / ICPB 4128) TaxID=530564 RepID=D2R002_PIRSD|nr:hypothetical protein [Pirellula staleyi]ADB18367.1 hypothetical protein Psta_3712 [Pirellula staleyi DSM 6068]